MLLLHQPQIVPDVPLMLNKAATRSFGAGRHQTLNLMLINIQSVLSKKEESILIITTLTLS